MLQVDITNVICMGTTTAQHSAVSTNVILNNVSGTVSTLCKIIQEYYNSVFDAMCLTGFDSVN